MVSRQYEFLLFRVWGFGDQVKRLLVVELGVSELSLTFWTWGSCLKLRLKG